jgi:hypothetical protein
MRRRTLLVALAVLAGVVALWPQTESRITVENFRRIREGMTLTEASAILGPPGDYSSLETVPVPTAPESEEAYLYATVEGVDVDFKLWKNDTAYAVLFLDKSGRITNGSSYPLRTVDHGALGNLLWRVKSLWRRCFPE